MDGWEERFDESGRKFYFHAAIGLTQWESPFEKEEPEPSEEQNLRSLRRGWSVGTNLVFDKYVEHNRPGVNERQEAATVLTTMTERVKRGVATDKDKTVIKRLVEHNKVPAAGKSLFLFTVKDATGKDALDLDLNIDLDSDDDLDEAVEMIEDTESIFFSHFPSRSVNNSPRHQAPKPASSISSSRKVSEARLAALRNTQQQSKKYNPTSPSKRKMTLEQLRGITQNAYQQSAQGGLQVSASKRGELKLSAQPMFKRGDINVKLNSTWRECTFQLNSKTAKVLKMTVAQDKHGHLEQRVEKVLLSVDLTKVLWAKADGIKQRKLTSTKGITTKFFVGSTIDGGVGGSNSFQGDETETESDDDVGIEEETTEANEEDSKASSGSKGGWARLRSATLFGSGISKDGIVTFPLHIAFKIRTGNRGDAAPSIKLSVSSEQERDQWVRAINHNVKLLSKK